MKRCKIGLRMAIFSILTLLAHGSFGEDWHCRDGKTYTNVHYMRHNLTTIQFSHSAGISMEKFTNLPDDIQERYGYNAQKVEQAQIQRQKQLEKQQEEIQKKKKYECIEVQRDDFKGTTTVRLKEELALETNPRFSANVSFMEGINVINLHFVSVRPASLGWRFLNSHHVYFLIDGERWQPIEDYVSDMLTPTYSCFESIAFLMPVERLESIIHAQSVRFKIGGEEFAFSKAHQEKMSVFLEYIRENYDMDRIIKKQQEILEFLEKRQKFGNNPFR